MNEKELRSMLQRKGDRFTPHLRPVSRLGRKARWRAARAITAGIVVITLAIPLAQLRQAPADDPAYAALVLRRNVATGDVPLPREHPHRTRGAAITLRDLENHRTCMRRNGIDLPPPVATEDGWAIQMTQPPEPTVRWREAAFVHCRLLDLSDDLVLGGRSRAFVRALIECVRAEGLTLPGPDSPAPGEFVFDLDAVDPPWGSQRWYRAIFVTCARDGG